MIYTALTSWQQVPFWLRFLGNQRRRIKVHHLAWLYGHAVSYSERWQYRQQPLAHDPERRR